MLQPAETFNSIMHDDEMYFICDAQIKQRRNVSKYNDAGMFLLSLFTQLLV